ncbi:protein MEI2-like 5 [Salvia divinorum]|uniref:Protein MEI2-like 5 n=1 Tax=Salvia divinorum TaxID=28513 RepID=A0ABD1HZQ2_SALDI
MLPVSSLVLPKIPFVSTRGKEKNAWRLPGSTKAYHASSHATRLSSSSLKLNCNESNQSGLSLDDGFPRLSKLQLQDEVLDPLPGDEDGLSDDFDLSWLPTRLEDLDGDDDQEQDEARGLRHPTSSPIEYFGSPVEQNSLHGYTQLPTFGTISGPQFHWESPTVHSGLITSQKGLLPLPSRAHGIGFPFPSGNQMERQFGLFPDSPEPWSYFSNKNRVPAAINLGFAYAGNFAESASASSRMMPMSRNGPIYFGATDRGRRRADRRSQMDNKRQYLIDLEKIRSGEDTRTTLMIKNIPNKYTSKMLLLGIDETHKSAYDFIYLPIDFKSKCNVGYAFINMVSPLHVISFVEAFDGKTWEKFNSKKVTSLSYARIQGKVALVSHFQNSSLMNEDKQYRPILFQYEGQESDDLANFSSSNLNIFVRRPDGSYIEDALDSPKGDQDHKP